MKPIKFLVPTLVLLALCGSPLGAQTAREWEAFAKKEEQAGNTAKALAGYLEAEKKAPEDLAILTQIAKQWGDYTAKLDNEGQRHDAAEKSLKYSRKALRLAPESAQANLSMAISHGKRVEFLGNREKIEASREVKKFAEKALRLDPESDYAHHLLGRWHQNVAGMGGATRAIAKLIYGGIPAGSYQEARDHFKKARELRPDRLIHQIEYGRTLMMMGQKAKGRAAIKKGLAMPNTEADDAAAKERGRGMW
jgi:tetratricopeptide (TPR) repeat protein